MNQTVMMVHWDQILKNTSPPNSRIVKQFPRSRNLEHFKIRIVLIATNSKNMMTYCNGFFYSINFHFCKYYNLSLLTQPYITLKQSKLSRTFLYIGLVDNQKNI